MKILVTGYSGQLGYDVVNFGKTLGFEMLGTSSNELDIRDERAVHLLIETVNPDAIIHCAAYTAVDNAEVDRETCHEVNVNGTRYLVEAAKKNGSKFMFISTDYVFNGEGTEPFKEQDNASPLGYYGLTKLMAEKTVVDQIDNYYIVRISWVFGINGKNFVKTMLKLSDSYKEINVVSDQIGSPTYTVDLSKLLIDMIQTNRFGIYHATNEGYCSWADFAEEIFHQKKLNVKVNRITSEFYRTTAKRPINSRLDKENLIKNGFSLLPHWKDALSRYLNELSMEEN